MSAVLAAADFFDKNGLHWILRWWHVVFGVAWIGLLYYFNFVQTPAFPTMEAAHRNGAFDKLVPRALWYFRWAAAMTAATGLVMLAIYASNYKGGYGHSVYAGSLIGLVMLANVWLVIWPAQQVVIANARGLLEGKPANPDAAKNARRALLASRTNAIFSITMLMFMTGAQNYFGASYEGGGSVVLWWILLLAVIVVLEANALGFIGGMEGPLTKPLAQHKNVFHIGVPIAVVVLLLWWILC
jgi:uncharacterized membrane protein